MRHLARLLGIAFRDTLLMPTFNKFPIKAHTSFKVEQHGVVNGPLSRYTTLTAEQFDTIERMTCKTYAEVLAQAAEFG